MVIPMANEHWLRWHHGSVTDPKWRVIASRCVTSVTVGHIVTVWAAMLENASQATPRGTLSGWDDEDIAVLFGYETGQVSAIRDAMQGKVLNGNVLIGWQKRQPNREDSSASRTREYRERNGDATKRTVTQCDATKRTVTLEERREEKKDQKLDATHLRIDASVECVGSDGFQPIIDAYHKRLPGCKHISVLNPKRKRRLGAVRKLAKKVCESQGWPYDEMEFFDAYFTQCADDPWMRGEVENPNNPNWKQNIDVLLAEDRFAGVMDTVIASMRASA